MVAALRKTQLLSPGCTPKWRCVGWEDRDITKAIESSVKDEILDFGEERLGVVVDEIVEAKFEVLSIPRELKFFIHLIEFGFGDV